MTLCGSVLGNVGKMADPNDNLPLLRHNTQTNRADAHQRTPGVIYPPSLAVTGKIPRVLCSAKINEADRQPLVRVVRDDKEQAARRDNTTQPKHDARLDMKD